MTLLVIQPYGLILLVAILAGTGLFLVRSRELPFSRDQLEMLILAGLLGGVVGAKVLFWLGRPELLAGEDFSPEIFLSGFSSWGGVLGGGVSVLVLVKKYQVDLREFLDTAVPVIPLVLAISRWGNIVNREFMPVALHLSLWNFAVLAVLLVLEDRISPERGSGVVFLVFSLSYGTGRFLLEFNRSHDILLWGLGLSQWFCLVLFLSGVALWRAEGTRDEDREEEGG